MIARNERGTLSKEHGLLQKVVSAPQEILAYKQFRKWKRKNKLLAFPLSDLVRVDTGH